MKTLEGAPKNMYGSFDCSGCTKLKTLEGLPDEIGGNLSCNFCNSLESLDGISSNIGGHLDFSWCEKLKSLGDKIPDVFKSIRCPNTRFERESFIFNKKNTRLGYFK